MAVDRFVIADAARADLECARPEVVAVARRLGSPAPTIDASALEHEGKKLGLGSSAAGAVAAAGAIMARSGAALTSASTLAEVLSIARSAHAESQPRGSGADMAAATYGGVVLVRRDGSDLAVRRVPWLEGLEWEAFALDRPTRTSEALDRLVARRATATVDQAMTTLVSAAERGERAWLDGDVGAFVEAARLHVVGLAALGSALDLALVPAAVSRRMSAHGAVWLPSGAGGGDVTLRLASKPVEPSEAASAAADGLRRIELSRSDRGLHIVQRAESEKATRS
jgi:phosphomevalonate kinase